MLFLWKYAGADILIFVARERSSGRKDGRTSRESDAPLNLPPPSANVQLLEQSFARKGLSLETWSLSQDLKEFFTVHRFLGGTLILAKPGARSNNGFPLSSEVKEAIVSV